MIKRNLLHKGNVFLFTIVTVMFWVVGCQVPIELDLPEEKKLVVLSNFAQEEKIVVRLGTTSNIDGTISPYPANADLKLYQDGAFLEQLKFHPETNTDPSYYISNQPAVIGAEYSLEGVYEDFPKVYARDIIPEKLRVQNIELSSKQITENFPGNFTYNLAVDIYLFENDGEDYFLHLKLLDDYNFYYIDNHQDTIFVPIFDDNVTLALSDNSIKHITLFHEPGILFNRSALPDRNKIGLVFTINSLPNSNIKGNLPVQIRKGSNNYYQFHKSVGEQEITSVNNGIFSIPSTIIFNNIENGIGNFGGYASTVVTYKM